MAPMGSNQDQPWLGRESLFRRKLNQLRTTGQIGNLQQAESVNRIKELEKSTYIDQAYTNLAKGEPQEMEKMTLLDNLTELYNHQTIMRILRDELKRGKRYKYASVVLVVSIDGLSEILAKFNQLAVDSILQGTANFLMKTIRDVDIPARYDSTTFLMICPNTDLSGGTVLAERIRNNISQDRISDVGQNWTVTASIGLIEFPGLGSGNEEDVVRLALEAMTDVRSRGGNAVGIAETAEPAPPPQII
jgi:diguanylate cyclase (GGDEF)-like protein